MNIPLFRSPAGKSYFFTFVLVSSLFLLWGFCNGMIDIMDKHFQDQLSLTKAQSAWVQFAHYMGYAIMALPAGLLTRKIGYKGGIIFGLLLVAAGGFWFLPATSIAAFWAFLLGVCLIAMGLTVLETVANPYTTVLGPKEYAATRINLAQSMNGVGWIFGPIVGAQFFYAQAGATGGPVEIYVPYVGVGVVVLVIAVLFFFASVPDVKTEDEYHTDDQKPAVAAERQVNHGLAFAMMFLNVVFVGLSVYLVLHTILPFCGVSETNVNRILAPVIALATLATLPFLRGTTKSISTHSIWAHPHFSGATVAQFVYIAAQAGIFSFFINVMTVDSKTGFCLVPALPAGWADIGWLKAMFEAGKDGVLHISNKGAGTLASAGFICFLLGRLIGAALMGRYSAHRILALFATLSIVASVLVIAQLGWLSVACVFLLYFCMSIMYPTIFALGIHGLGAQAKKKAAAFIVMSITGGALLPKFMGWLGDEYNMAFAFIMPLACFVLVALYGLLWPKLSGEASLTGVSTARGH
jgi:FHS family L-fucose permease-like MFS transporter